MFLFQSVLLGSVGRGVVLAGWWGGGYKNISLHYEQEARGGVGWLGEKAQIALP